MQRDDLSIAHLKFLKSLYETKSLSLTAAQLRLSRPSASRSLQALRGLFADNLFMRTAGGFQPTARMRELYVDIGNMIDAERTLFREKVFDIHSFDEVVRIAAQDNAVVLYLADPISNMINAHPKLRFRIERFDRNSLAALEEGRINFACFPTTNLPENFCSIELDRTPRSVVVRKGHPLVNAAAGGRALTAADLAPYGRIRNSTRSELGADIYNIPTVLQKMQFEPVLTPYFISQATFLLKTDAMAFLPRSTGKLFQKFYPGSLEILPIEGGAGLALSPRLIWHRNSDNDPASQWIRSMIVAAQKPFDMPLVNEDDGIKSDVAV